LARFRADAGPLSDRLAGGAEAGPCRLVRIGEYLQRDADALTALCVAGLRPGAVMTARCDQTRLTLTRTEAPAGGPAAGCAEGADTLAAPTQGQAPGGSEPVCHLDADWSNQVFVADL
jgi:hypothetical protein